MIKAKNLTKKYGNKIAVDELNLIIKEGELFALLGVNGAGKTTTINMLTRLIKPTTGEIIIDVDSKDINISPQETAIAPNLTVKENLEFIAGVYNIDKNRVSGLMKEFKLDEFKNQKSKTLSGGYKRRLSIAMALINAPKILYLDEPTLGLDVIARRELWNIIEKLKGKTTIILTTHYMEEAEKLSDRVGIMANGKLLEMDTSRELIKKSNADNFEDAFVKIATGGEL